MHHQRLVSCSGGRSALRLVNSKCEQALDECEERERERENKMQAPFIVSVFPEASFRGEETRTEGRERERGDLGKCS